MSKIVKSNSPAKEKPTAPVFPANEVPKESNSLKVPKRKRTITGYKLPDGGVMLHFKSGTLNEGENE